MLEDNILKGITTKKAFCMTIMSLVLGVSMVFLLLTLLKSPPALAHPLPSYPKATSAYCDAGIREEDETIANVQVGTITNTTGYFTATNGYSDYTLTHSTDMRVGVEYPITITLSASYSDDKGRIWVDWNQDEDFNDTGESISMRVSKGKGPYYATIVPPAHAFGGSTRMRVRMQYHDYPPKCGDTNYGEIEDYTVNVVPDSAPFYAHSTKTAAVDYENWRITYTVAISNAGDLNGPGTYLTDTIPAGVTYVSATASTGVVTESVGAIEWRGDVISGTTEYLTFTVSIDGAPLTNAMIANTAHITHTDAPEWTRPQHVLNISPPEFSGTKEGPTAAALNAPVTYTLNVRNDGGLPAYTASLEDTFPSGVVGPALNPVLDGPGALVRNDATGLEWNGRLDPGEEFTLTFQLLPTSYCGQVLANTVVITDPDAAAALTFTAPPMDVYQARLDEWDFEGNDGAFLGSGDWARGAPVHGPAEAHSGSELWGTVLGGNYRNDPNEYPNEDFTSVLTKTLDLSGVESATLVWWQWLKVYDTWDVTYIEAITSTGSAELIYGSKTRGAYRSDVTEKVWERKSVDLTLYAGDTVTLTFILDPDSSLSAAGWYLDDVGVYEDCNLYVWEGDVSTAWSASGNWDPPGNKPGTIPGADDNVRIPGQSVTLWPTIGDTRACNDLTIEPGAAVTLTSAATLTISDTLYNWGYLIRQKTVNTGSSVSFSLPASSSANEEVAIITPSASGLGNVSVGVRAGLPCGVTGNLLSAVWRCFSISPASSYTSTIRFYYRSDELGVPFPNNPSTMNVYRWDTATSAWTQATVTGRGSIIPPYWVEAETSDYSPFTLKSGDAPSAVSISRFGSSPDVTEGYGFVFGIVLILLSTVILIRRSRYLSRQSRPTSGS